MLLSNTICSSWCFDYPNECKKAKTSYCENNPYSFTCIDWCKKGEISGEICNAAVRNYCQGSNLMTDTCERFCNNKDGNCDNRYREYCASLGDREAIKNPFCGCFMSPKFYDDFFKQLNARGIEWAGIPPKPECYYSYCASSPIKNNYCYTTNNCKCPDINQCINKITINVDGKIEGDVKINQSNECGFQLRPQDCGPIQRIDKPTNKCVDCPVGTVPNQLKTDCICPGNKILKDGKCVCPDTFILDGNECKCPVTFVLSEDKKSCVCPSGTVQIGNICVVPEPEDFTLDLINYIKNDLPINNEIDKQKIIVNAPDIANSVLRNGCNENLNIAKECSNFIPSICSINGAQKYCKDNSDDIEFCNIDGTPKIINSAYGFSCDKIRKERKIECKDNEYYDPSDNKCKTCPEGMRIKKDKSGCEEIPSIECKENEYIDENKKCKPCPSGTIHKPDKSGCNEIKCGDNAYLDLETFICVECGEDKIADKINHICVPKDTLERQLREYIKSISIYENIDYTLLNIHAEEIVRIILENSECKVNLNSAKKCVDNFLDTCNDDPTQTLYGFSCNKISKNGNKNSNLIFIIIGVIILLIILGLVFRKKK